MYSRAAVNDEDTTLFAVSLPWYLLLRYSITCCCVSRPPALSGTYFSHLAEIHAAAARAPRIKNSPRGGFFGFDLSPNIGWSTAQQSSAEINARAALGRQ